MNLYIFEDKNWKNFLPLVYTRPVFDLRTGILKLKQKIEHNFPEFDSGYIMRPELEALYQDRFPHKSINSIEKGTHLFVNGSIILNSDLIEKIKGLSKNDGLFSKDTCLAFKKKLNKSQKLDSTHVTNLIEDVKLTQQIQIDILMPGI